MEKKSMQHLVMGLVIGLLVAGAAFMLFVSMNASDGDYLGFVRGQKVKNKTVNQKQNRNLRSPPNNLRQTKPERILRRTRAPKNRHHIPKRHAPRNSIHKIRLGPRTQTMEQKRKDVRKYF